MKTILNIILLMCLTFYQLTPFTPLVLEINSINNSSEKEDIHEENTQIDTEIEIPIENTESVNTEEMQLASNFITIDLEGYCSINIPMSHFTVSEANSTTTYKQLDYVDNKTRLYMSYVTGMSESTDIPGYITNEKAAIDTITNDRITLDIDGTTWYRVKADHQEDDCNLYVWYSLNKTSTSAIWIRGKVSIDSDDDTFHSVVEQILKTYYLYAASGTIFDTPSTGVYTEFTPDNTVADTSEFQANSNDNNVFVSRGGYVLGADISSDWKDMEIILDGVKFSLPSKFSSFEDAGYYISDTRIEDEEDLQVYPNSTLTLKVRNDNGTVVTITGYNESSNDINTFSDCTIVKLVIRAEDFIDVVPTNEDEVYNEETAEGERTSINAKDDFNHELILANGITWGVYADDIKNCYGPCRQTAYDDTKTQLVFTSGNNTLYIRVGVVHTIHSIEMSCMNL